MSEYPRLNIDVSKIQHNTRTIIDLANKVDINVTGVTKATCGDPRVAGAMIKGGVCSLADSRVSNIKRIRQVHPKVSCMLLRTPMLSDIASTVKHADISLNSDAQVITALGEAATRMNQVHNVVIMVEMGDLREGVPKDQVAEVVNTAIHQNGVNLQGIGMNLACFGGVVPTFEKIQEFTSLVTDLEAKYNISFDIVSGGNSANIPLLVNAPKKTKINHLRIGEGILLGRETVNRTAIPHTYQDAFIVEAELIEQYTKASVPSGEISQDAFGHTPSFKDRGDITRGIVALGRQDTIIEDLMPLDSSVSILGGSSDHVLLHMKKNSYNVGDIIQFTMKYGALVHLCTSRYVKKRYTS